MKAVVGILIALLAAVAPTYAQDPALTWLGHAAFKYTTRDGKVILIDPWLNNPKAPKNIGLTHVEAILVTHGHSDHVGEAFELARKYNAPLVASYELTQLATKRGVKNVLPLNPSGSVEVAGVKVTATEAVHSSSYTEGENTFYAGAPLGFVIQEYGSSSIYHSGDTGVFDGMALISRLYQPQIALLPIGGVYTMKPAEAALAVNLVAAQVVVPMHFGTFPALAGSPADLEKELTKNNIRIPVRELKPGSEIKIKDLK